MPRVYNNKRSWRCHSCGWTTQRIEGGVCRNCETEMIRVVNVRDLKLERAKAECAKLLDDKGAH